MRTTAIINQKGGCGKTTVAVNLAAELARHHCRTLLVDMDPQGHCALGLSVPEAQIHRSMAELLTAGLDGSTSVVETVWQVARRLDLLPATMSLAGVEQRLAGASDKDRRLAQVLATVEGHYDFCVIDCPPAIGLLTFNALRAADEVLVPVETGYFALQGAIKQQQTIEMLARRVAHRLKLHVLATMYDPAAEHARPLFSELQRHFSDYLIPATIHHAGALKEAASFGQAVSEYAPDSPATRDFARLARWLIEHPPAGGDDFAPAEATGSLASAGDPTDPSPPVVGQPAGPEAAPASPTPHRSRAAELVERARQLSARTAELSRKIDQPESSNDESAASAPRTDEPAPSTGAAEPSRDPAGSAQPAATPRSPQRPLAGQSTLVPTAEPSADSPLREPAPADSDQPAERLRHAFGARATRSGLLFVQPAEGSQQVAVAGDFNNWDPTATPLQRDARLGVWQRCVPVPAGRYRYRVVVDGKSQPDPYNTHTERDAGGSLCSVVTMSG